MQPRHAPPHRFPLHFESIDLSTRRGTSQTLSFALHAAIIAALILLATTPKAHKFIGSIPLPSSDHFPEYFPPADSTQSGRPSLGQDGGGGNHEPFPTTSGRFAPRSSSPILPPQKIINETPLLPEPTSIFDANAPTAVPVITDLGLPWMPNKTTSAGPGGPHGFGSGTGNTMGDKSGDGEGIGNSGGPYANVVSQVACLYCPEPPYTEEARKNKLQGKMVVKVLVGQDGRATRISVVNGLGMGLDESAERTIASWHFSPARDAAKRPVATWVTIETRFQLF